MSAPGPLVPSFGETLRKAWRKPARTPQLVLNHALESLHPEQKSAESWPARLTSACYNQHPQLTAVRRSISRACARARQAAGDAAVSPRGDVLVFLLRAFGYPHAYHHYLIACALRELGFNVTLVFCDGVAESCGSGACDKPLSAPPFLCRECRTLAGGFQSPDFPSLSLTSFSHPEEEHADLALLENLRGQDWSALGVAGLDWRSGMYPYLLRFFRGHRNRINLDEPESRRHVLGMIRQVRRYERLLQERKPKGVVLFNGLFAPENLFQQINWRLGVAGLYTERGPRRDTLFISDEAACHYQSDRIWRELEPAIGVAQILEAREILKARTQSSEDPSGVARPVHLDDIGRYDEISRRPYVLFFLPVLHDTASMEKSSIFGSLLGAIDHLCQTAAVSSKRLVIRCHPDEDLSSAAGCYRLADYLSDQGYLASPSIQVLEGREQWSGYELARRADAVVVYNGTLGQELPALGYSIYNISESHYATKGFTQKIDSMEKLPEIFSSQKQPLSPEKQELALRYLWYYYKSGSIDLGKLMHEAQPSKFIFPEPVAQEDAKAVMTALRDRVKIWTRDW